MKVFITGVTGYIGGEGLFDLYHAHPDWKYNLLVRNEEKGQPVKAAYPKANLVYGTLDDFKVIEEAAAQNDIVLHTADSSDHEGAARAIAKGLLAGHTASKPGYWIHVSGTGILCFHDSEAKRFGEPPLPEQTYDDLEGVDRLLNMPDVAFHRNIDKIVLETAAAKPDAVKVAILCPPTIYGQGRGPVNQRSRQVPGLVATTLKLGYAPKVGQGKAEWDQVHVHDLGELFALLATTASKGKNANEDEIWGPKAYYFVENGSFVWGDVAEWVAEAAAAKGYIPKAETKSVPVDQALEIAGFLAVTWGLNSVGKAKRAKLFLGWAPKGESLKETIPELIELEAKQAGKA